MEPEVIPQLESPIDGLYASAPETLPFAPGVDIRAFLLPRSRGNLLIYSTTAVDEGDPEIQDLGGVSRQYLNHRHEGMFMSDRVGAPLFLHAEERGSVEAKRHVRGTFSRRHMLDEDFEVIPTPGHTTGATAFLWDSGQHRFLFTGDTIYLDDGKWVAGLLESSDPVAFAHSLELVRELDFDVLVPWAATSGQPYHAITDRAETCHRVDAMLESIRRGELV
jgi:hypothetical protein